METFRGECTRASAATLSEKARGFSADVACMEGLTTHNSYLDVEPDLILEAIMDADALGEARLKSS